MNVVSACCNREIVGDIKLEYPLGGRTYAIPYKVDRCSGCGMEIDYDYQMVEICEICDEVNCHGECKSDCMD